MARWCTPTYACRRAAMSCAFRRRPMATRADSMPPCTSWMLPGAIASWWNCRRSRPSGMPCTIDCAARHIEPQFHLDENANALYCRRASEGWACPHRRAGCGLRQGGKGRRALALRRCRTAPDRNRTSWRCPTIPPRARSGRTILRRGGNAIDAIVAVAFAQAVVNPAAGNIGGGGFLVYRQHDGEVFALDFREAAPLRRHARHVRGLVRQGQRCIARGRACRRRARLGGRALGNAPALRCAALARGGPPCRGAREGARARQPARRVARGQRRQLRARSRPRRRSSSAATGAHGARATRCTRPTSPAPSPSSPTAAPTSSTAAASPTRLRSRCSWAAGSSPAKTSRSTRRSGARRSSPPIGDGAIITMPPVSGGGATLIQALNILEGYDLPAPGTAALAHLQVEALRRAFLDRNTLLGDPAFVNMPIAELTSKPYATTQRSSIATDRATPLAGLGARGGTAHDPLLGGGQRRQRRRRSPRRSTPASARDSWWPGPASC